MSRRVLRLLLVVAMLAGGCAGDGGGLDAARSPPPSPSPIGPTPTPTEIPGPDDGVLATLAADGRFSTFLRMLLVEGSERIPMFLGSPVWNNTLFSPTDEAFESLPEGALDYLFSDGPQAEFDLLRVIEHHVVDGVRTVEDLEPGELQTIAGTLEVTVEEDGAMVDGATVIEADVPASNGIIHIVDRVLIPSYVELP